MHNKIASQIKRKDTKRGIRAGQKYSYRFNLHKHLKTIG
jgi:hypothetical protein